MCRNASSSGQLQREPDSIFDFSEGCFRKPAKGRICDIMLLKSRNLITLRPGVMNKAALSTRDRDSQSKTAVMNRRDRDYANIQCVAIQEVTRKD